jgi:hypothetical protein
MCKPPFQRIIGPTIKPGQFSPKAISPKGSIKKEKIE